MKTNYIFKVTLLCIFITQFYSVNAQSDWLTIQKVVSSDRALDDNFGSTVAISGNYALVMANWEDHDTSGLNFKDYAGSGYIYENISGQWVQKIKIVASDRNTDDGFGGSASISDNYIVVGAPLEDEDENGLNTRTNAGSAYIFERDLITEKWTQKKKIVAPDRASGDVFGVSVSISGDFLIAGAYLERNDENGNNEMIGAGSAYIFKRNNATESWIFHQKIVAPDRAINDYFGRSVAISGDNIIVGAYQEDEDTLGNNTLSLAGSAYIYSRNTITDTWSFQQKIIAPDRQTDDRFGYRVAIHNNSIIIGVPYEDHNENGLNPMSSAGSAYIYEKNNITGKWDFNNKLVANDRAIDDFFGATIAINGDYAVVGAYTEDHNQDGLNMLTSSGSAYIFKKNINTGIWSQQQKVVASDRASNDEFGCSVAISGSTVLIGAHYEDEDSLGNSTLFQAGSAYFFQQEQLLLPTITTQEVDNITDAAASLNGTITFLGSPEASQYGFVWSTSPNPTIDNSTIIELGIPASTGQFTSILTELTENTTYYVNTFITNAGGTFYGNEVHFTTQPLLEVPVVITISFDSLTTNSVKCHGNIIYLGTPNQTHYGFVWDTSSNPTVELPTKTNHGLAVSTGSFTSLITGLSENTTYYARSYATNSAGTSYGSEIYFTTKITPVPPTVVTEPVDDISDVSATCHGHITNLGTSTLVTQHGFVWSTDPAPTIDLATIVQKGTTIETGSFSSLIIGLTNNTTYYVRAYATSSAGTGYGNEISFVSGSVTSIDQVQSNEFYIFPNPTNDKLNFKGIIDASTIQIIDVNGNIMVLSDIKDDVSIPINLLPSGTYQIIICSDKGIKYQSKFLKYD